MPPQPDGRIRQGSGKTVGNDIYNTTGAQQAVEGAADIGETITFDITIQNDFASDKLKVRASGPATGQYSVTYFRGTTDVTAKIVSGLYTTPVLAQGVTFLITATGEGAEIGHCRLVRGSTGDAHFRRRPEQKRRRQVRRRDDLGRSCARI